jgi:antitoxin component YwqK of YwqJK toxin-antitoxin module
MARILKEEKYPNGSLKFRETELYGQLGKQVILKEGWYPPQVNPLDPAGQQLDGYQEYKWNFVNGQLYGLQERWYRNGQQWYKQNYVNGQQHGVQERWSQNGQQQYKLDYVNEQQHGVQEGWYPSEADPEDPSAQQRGSQQLYKENFVNGQYHGIQEYWYRNGQWESKVNYVNGRLHGIQERWRRNGQWESKVNYVNGRLHGSQEAWSENGQQWYKKYYLDGDEVSQQAYQSYIRGLAPEVQAATDFGERGLSGIIAGYLLP